jgi:NitT/TauT family transport system ATP-binding protein
MTARPGRIKHVFDIPEQLHSETDDVRSLPLFGSVRHDIWTLLRDEVLKTQQDQTAPVRKQDALAAPLAAALAASRAIEEPAHV